VGIRQMIDADLIIRTMEWVVYDPSLRTWTMMEQPILVAEVGW